MTFTAPNGQKVTTNVAITTTNKALTYRGVTFNFDAKGIDATKEKAIHFDQLQTDPSGTSYLYKNGQKVTGLKTFDASVTISMKMAVKPKAQRSQSMVRLTN